jgi:hypothetical protein
MSNIKGETTMYVHADLAGNLFWRNEKNDLHRTDGPAFISCESEWNNSKELIANNQIEVLFDLEYFDNVEYDVDDDDEYDVDDDDCGYDRLWRTVLEEETEI